MVKLYRRLKKRLLKRRPRRSYRKRYSKSRKPNNMGFRPLGLKQASILKYVQQITMDPTAGGNQSWIFSANGCYDPDITSSLAGHQPYGFDQLMAMYNHYTVVGSKCQVIISNSQGSLPIYAGILLRDTSIPLGTSTGTEYILEQPGNKMRLLGYGTSGAGGKANVMTCRFSAKKFFSKSRGAIVEDIALRGDVYQNPAEQAYYHVVLAPQTSADNIGQQAVMVQIEYYVVFTEPKILGSS